MQFTYFPSFLFKISFFYSFLLVSQFVFFYIRHISDFSFSFAFTIFPLFPRKLPALKTKYSLFFFFVFIIRLLSPHLNPFHFFFLILIKELKLGRNICGKKAIHNRFLYNSFEILLLHGGHLLYDSLWKLSTFSFDFWLCFSGFFLLLIVCFSSYIFSFLCFALPWNFIVS